MTPLPALRLRGFTRFELAITLVVLAVVGFLTFPICGCGGSRTGTRIALTQTVIRGVETACVNYMEDYKTAPTLAPPRSQDAAYFLVGSQNAGATQSNAALFDVLRAIPRGANSQHKLNKREVKYFEEKKATDSKYPRDGFADGKEFATEIQGQLLDPWGEQYCIVMETDHDASLDLSSIYTDLTGPQNTVKKRVGVFSLGQDGQLGGKQNRGKLRRSDGVPSDFVSWND